MSDPFVLVGVIVGLLMLAGYLFLKRVSSNIFDGISLVSAGVGLLAGIKLCYFSYKYREIFPIKEVSVQTLLGGIAVIWVSAVTASRKLRT